MCKKAVGELVERISEFLPGYLVGEKQEDRAREESAVELIQVGQMEHEALPVKAQALLRSIVKSGVLSSIAASVNIGVNPFANIKPKYMEIAFEALLSGGFSKKGLRELLMSRLGWGETTAFPHVTKIVAVLLALNVIEQGAETFTLKSGAT